MVENCTNPAFKRSQLARPEWSVHPSEPDSLGKGSRNVGRFSRMTISDQTDPPLSGVITNTVFGPNTFSASETSWLMPLIDVIFVNIQSPLGKNIFDSDTIHFFKTQHLIFKTQISVQIGGKVYKKPACPNPFGFTKKHVSEW